MDNSYTKAAMKNFETRRYGSWISDECEALVPAG